MKENLLHFIWKFQLFSNKKLQTVTSENIQVVATGLHNFNTGPDFSNAKIIINNQLWAGNVEIHVKSSDWYLHAHETDENYDAVILHVVWEHDVDVFRKSNTVIPTLALKNYISTQVLDNYQALFSKNKKWINCENEISLIDDFLVSHWLERLYFERLEEKSAKIQEVLKLTNNNWEAVLFVLFAKNFGLKINGEAFFNFATSFDFSIVRKLSTSRLQLEALFFGQAGLLFNSCESVYFENLKREYEYLKIKFKLTSISKGQVHFFRLRPNNFPTIRLSQLVSLYHLYQNLFSKIIEIETIEDYYSLFDLGTSAFWETHYTFETESKKSAKKLSKAFVDLLLINTIIPLKFKHLQSLGKTDFSSLIAIVEEIKPEKNSIISKFEACKIKSDSAFKTQALLQLKNNYCSKQLCLQCEIGKEVLKN
ncbi:Protein of unknown function [Lutibacter agarilyticus]|uniref:DUF2851 domain-containing protein n=1 Tax=Lutibacter agarilyticus TaxID=1109740 RepID=A0A238X1A8_9FLAO|nr:DUF2851 family protein [Lutibacter agarilyticus]SNR52234.1 Protein of unknown function [Lutibacter agarilyticus]